VPGIEIIKAFAVHAGFDLASSAPYEPYCALFLFDTQSAVPGGSGASFDWSLLSGYRGQLDYLLSGGIGRSNFKQALAWVRGHERAAGLDLNSRIETAPASNRCPGGRAAEGGEIMSYTPDGNGFFGRFGGAFVPEMLHPNVEELQKRYPRDHRERFFQREFRGLLKDYGGGRRRSITRGASPNGAACAST
jgi:phosphoribosylanthranilate isomerase